VPEGSLRRLGGGRWRSRDGRFTIEPQSGTWVVVDGEQVDDLGLPLVRGPFHSLNDAREAIDGARQAGPADSPLSARVEEARRRGGERRSRGGQQRATAAPGATEAKPAERQKPAPQPSPPKPKEPPAPPPEPAWFTKLDADDGRRARKVLRDLEKAGISDAESIARSEVADGRPALARLAIEQRIRAAIEAAHDAATLAQAIADLLVSGRDRQLGTSWRLVDGEERPITALDVTS
jgi:hypothetical protein